MPKLTPKLPPKLPPNLPPNLHPKLVLFCAEFVAEVAAEIVGAVSGGAGQEDMLVAGDERDEFKSVALSIVEAVGFKPRYVGPIRYARNLEAIAELWIHLAVPPAGDTKEDWGRNFNFALHGI